MKCPECGHKWKHEGAVKGGETSRRKLTQYDQDKMQAARREARRARERARNEATR